MPQPIQIKRPDVADDIRKLAELAGLSITDAVSKAVKTQLEIERVKAEKKRALRLKNSQSILEEIWSLPVIGPTLTDDDLYDENGLPK